MIYVDGTLISPNDRQVTVDLQTVRTFLGEHGNALANAAYLLGGGAASGMVFSLIDDIRQARRISKAHIRRLRSLHALLLLENVGEPDRIETALCAEIIPGSRAVEEISLLTDRLGDLFRCLRAGEQTCTAVDTVVLSEVA